MGRGRVELSDKARKIQEYRQKEFNKNVKFRIIELKKMEDRKKMPQTKLNFKSAECR